jgi:predicted ATPase
MIDTVSFANFRVLRHVSTSLERFTVIVGPNASGKSSILLGLHLLCEAGKNWPQGRPPIPNLGSNFSRDARNEDLLVECTRLGSTIRLQAIIQPPGLPVTPPQSSLVWKESAETAQWQPLTKPQIIPSASLLRLEAAHLAKPGYTTAAVPVLGPTGEGLHSSLAYLALNQPDAFQELQTTLNQIIPAIRRIRFARIPVRQVESVPLANGDRTEVRYEEHAYTTELVLFDTNGATSIPANLASEGTLLVLGILTMLYGPDRPQLLLLDDLDRGLHPKAQLELVAILRSLLDRHQDLQIIATTHSPYILDKMNSNEVRLATLGEDGWAVCGRLQDHPEFERWKEEMTPGEFWMMFGEKWLTTAIPE